MSIVQSERSSLWSDDSNQEQQINQRTASFQQKQKEPLRTAGGGRESEDEPSSSAKQQSQQGFTHKVLERVRGCLPSSDTFFVYNTKKDLRVLDRRLGFTYLFLAFIILLYILIYVAFIRKLFLEKEKAYGETFLSIHGQAHSYLDGKLHIWDRAELLPNFVENSALFLPTRIHITRNQKKGLCATQNLPCLKDTDCAPGSLPNIVETSKCHDITMEPNPSLIPNPVSMPKAMKGCIVQ